MSKKVSMEDIARKLGLSKNTVSLALRGMHGVSSRTRSLVIETAGQLGYRYKTSEGVPAKNSGQENICLILSKSLRNSIGFYSHIQFGIESEAKKNHLNIILCYYDEDAKNFETPLCISSGMVSGIVTLGHISRGTLDSVIGYGLPVVVIDEYFDELKLNYVLTDNLCGGYEATTYLIGCGHREIGFSGDIRRASSFYDRYLGFVKAMQVHGLTPNPSHLLVQQSLQQIACSQAGKTAEVLKSLPSLPTAFFCCNDQEALMLYKALKMMGIRIPEDVSVIGFDDIESATDVSPELTTMRVEKERMGKRAVARLMEAFEMIKIAEKRKGLDEEDAATEKILIPTTLIQRQSIRRLE